MVVQTISEDIKEALSATGQARSEASGWTLAEAVKILRQEPH